MTNGFLVSVPHERLHGTISILKQRPELPTNVCKVRAVKDVMPLIAYCMRTAQRAPAQLPGDPHWCGHPALQTYSSALFQRTLVSTSDHSVGTLM